MLGHERVDHGPRDADPGRERREVVHPIPAGVLYLLRVHSKLAAGIIGGKPDHERVRERPRLAPEVPHVRDLDPDLLAYLPLYGLLYRFAWLDEARQHAVHFRRKARRTGEQNL